MEQFLLNYIDPTSDQHDKWMGASRDTTKHQGRGEWFSQQLQEWSCAFIEDDTFLPTSATGCHNTSIIDDEDLQLELCAHLQSIGKYVVSQDIVQFMEQPDIQTCYGLKKGISEWRGRNWMNKLGYWWTEDKKGQYVDGHKRDDIIEYWQKIFLPIWKALEPYLQNWHHDGTEDATGGNQTWPRQIVLWFHDESTFYVHD
jgi:hypothetical protein